MRYLLLLVCLVLQPIWALHGTAVAADTDEPVLEDHAEFVESALDIEPSHYEIEVTMSTTQNGGLLEGSMELEWVNLTDDDVEALPLRLFANDNTEVMTIDTVTVDGEDVELEYGNDPSVVNILFDSPVEPGESQEIALSFESEIPYGSVIHYGIFGIDQQNGTWALAHWYPVVAGWNKADGFLLDPPSVNGDPIFTNTATYEVTVTADEELVLVTTGVETDRRTRNGLQEVTFSSGPTRDFAMVADEDFEVTSIEVDGTLINSWYLPGQEAHGEAVATYAGRALEYFNDEIGAYPYTDLDLLSVEVYGALGVEFPQLIYMARDYYSRDFDFEAPNALEFTVAHEVLHQWFYNLIGNNQYQHAFIDEGITNYLSGDLYFRHVYGDDEGAAWAEIAFRAYYAGRIDAGDDVIVDTPTDEFETENDYVFAVYYKAPMGFAAIYEETGERDFYRALSAYFDDFAFGVAEPEDMLDAFEDASDTDLDDLWELWFEEVA